MAGEPELRTKDPNEGENRPREVANNGLREFCHGCGVVPVPLNG